MKKIIISLLATLVFAIKVNAQGCVIVRNIAGFGQYNLTDNAFSDSKWQLNITNRYFKSFREFIGSKDQNASEQNRAIVKSYSLNISIGRMMKNGWSLDLSVPFASNSREACVEHGGANTTRHTTRTFGIGDIRFTAYKWILQPTIKQRGNIQFGLGIKLPTGDYKYQDYFYRNDSTRVLAPVNPSIQLGDGGTGIITELNTFYILNATRTISFYANFYYLINAREQNGVSITAGKTPTTLQIKTGSVEASVPDQYSVRVGINYNFRKISFSAGFRDEGIPAYDLIGGSNGFRRAGHNISAEPGIVFRMKTISVFAYAPVIIGRKIKQTVPDKKETAITGTYTVKPGGFANYLLFAGVSLKL